MTRRELVKAAIEHREAPRVPYIIDLCPDAWEALKPLAGEQDAAAFIANDVVDIAVPWWQWHELAPDWHGMAAPTSRPKVQGTGSYMDLPEHLKRLREASDKYFLVRLYGIHFEKAYFARGFENFLSDMVSDPTFAGSLLRR
ncbi:MAG: hypothetical protein FJX74_23495, partial [Armatimonadetes bacterium]|nr:hypothetical protein [Armatimonadota bacterium]